MILHNQLKQTKDETSSSVNDGVRSIESGSERLKVWFRGLALRVEKVEPSQTLEAYRGVGKKVGRSEVGSEVGRANRQPDPGCPEIQIRDGRDTHSARFQKSGDVISSEIEIGDDSIKLRDEMWR